MKFDISKISMNNIVNSIGTNKKCVYIERFYDVDGKENEYGEIKRLILEDLMYYYNVETMMDRFLIIPYMVSQTRREELYIDNFYIFDICIGEAKIGDTLYKNILKISIQNKYPVSKSESNGIFNEMEKILDSIDFIIRYYLVKEKKGIYKFKI